MKRLAIFVEGQTEALFVSKLLAEFVSAKSIEVCSCLLRGGQKEGGRTMREIHARGSRTDAAYYVIIANCGGDNKVASDVADHYDSLVEAGYESIIAIRDVFPIPAGEIARLERSLGFGIKTKPITPHFVLGVMEIESWFVSEHTHFERIHSGLTPELIQQKLGFDVRAGDIQQRHKPSADLNAAYALVGMGYSKKKSRVERTVDALDYAEVCLTVKGRIAGARKVRGRTGWIFYIAPYQNVTRSAIAEL